MTKTKLLILKITRLVKFWFNYWVAMTLLLLSQLLVLPVQAGNWWEAAKQGGIERVGEQAYGTTGEPPHLVDIIAYIIKVFLGLLGIIFVTLIVWAGYKWMMAAGNEDKVKEAKQQLQTGVIGLVIIFVSYALARFVFRHLTFVTTGVMPLP